MKEDVSTLGELGEKQSLINYFSHSYLEFVVEPEGFLDILPCKEKTFTFSRFLDREIMCFLSPRL